MKQFFNVLLYFTMIMVGRALAGDVAVLSGRLFDASTDVGLDDVFIRIVDAKTLKPIPTVSSVPTKDGGKFEFSTVPKNMEFLVKCSPSNYAPWVSERPMCIQNNTLSINIPCTPSTTEPLDKKRLGVLTANIKKWGTQQKSFDNWATLVGPIRLDDSVKIALELKDVQFASSSKDLAACIAVGETEARKKEDGITAFIKSDTDSGAESLKWTKTGERDNGAVISSRIGVRANELKLDDLKKRELIDRVNRVFGPESKSRVEGIIKNGKF